MKSLFVVLMFLLTFQRGRYRSRQVSDEVLYDEVRIKIANDREVGGGQYSGESDQRRRGTDRHS